jgi:hypothetical protein
MCENFPRIFAVAEIILFARFVWAFFCLKFFFSRMRSGLLDFSRGCFAPETMLALWAFPKINKINDLPRFFQVLLEVHRAAAAPVLCRSNVRATMKPNRRPCINRTKTAPIMRPKPRQTAPQTVPRRRYACAAVLHALRRSNAYHAPPMFCA